jgi:glucosamine--fructose-6-phosphate aminotransferase (isomerizing)
VAATKTYTAELLALLLLVEAVRGHSDEERRALAQLPDLARATIEDRRRPSWPGGTGSPGSW